MSKGKTPEILEIDNPVEVDRTPNQEITCRGQAEWSEGQGPIEYGAHVSQDGGVVLSYRQM